MEALRTSSSLVSGGLRSAVGLVLLLACMVVRGADLPPGVSLLPEDALGAFRLSNSLRKNLTCTRVPVTGQVFGEALRVETTQVVGASPAYAAILKADTTGPIAVGDVIVIAFRMRTLEASNEEGEGRVIAALQQRGGKHAKLVVQNAVAGPTWKEFCFHARAREANAAEAGRAHVDFWLNTTRQIVEIADIRLVNLGSDIDASTLPRTEVTYPGRELDAPWRAEAAARIERHRKADLQVRVTDSAGKPVEGAEVLCRMTRHAFLWGTSAGRILTPGDGDLGGIAAADRERYRGQLLRWFNQVSPEWQLKDRGWDTPDSWVASQALAGLRWARANDLSVYGHWLVCAAGFTKDSLFEKLTRDRSDAGKEALKEKYFAMVRAKLGATRGLVGSWDITHPVANFGRTRLEEIYGTEIYSDLIRIAREEAPGLPIYVNEAGVLTGGQEGGYRRPKLAEFVRMLARQGTPANGICFQSHFGASTLTGPADLYAVLDQYAQEFKLPMRLTELDLDAGDDEELQGDYLRDVITVAFSHPAIEAITQWGFWEGSHWKPNRALIRKDWTLKPAGKAFEDLVFRQWWTKADGQTGKTGAFVTRGFLGTYEITVKSGGRTQTVAASLGSGGATVEVRLPEPGQ